MTTEIFVIAHKDCSIPKIEGYKKLQVGAAKNGRIRGFDYYDDEGDNISSKNPNYCELTGLYWIWKHSTADIVGLCHYRRYFTKSFLSTKSKYYLTSRNIENILDKYDVILPLKRRYVETTLEAVRHAPNAKDMQEMKEAISFCCPNYLDDYLKFLDGNSAYLYNMFIMKKEMSNSYCEWLFPILSYIEERHDMSAEDEYRSRLFGFLSERLIYVWVIHNVSKDRIYETRVVKTDESNTKNLINDVKNPLRNVAYQVKRSRHVNKKYK